MARNETQLPALRSAEPARPGADAAGLDPHVLAQSIGQAGGRRGLRGGPPVLQAARRAYLHAEWAVGPDRRSPAGAVLAASA